MVETCDFRQGHHAVPEEHEKAGRGGALRLKKSSDSRIRSVGTSIVALDQFLAKTACTCLQRRRQGPAPRCAPVPPGRGAARHLAVKAQQHEPARPAAATAAHANRPRDRQGDAAPPGLFNEVELAPALPEIALEFQNVCLSVSDCPGPTPPTCAGRSQGWQG